MSKVYQLVELWTYAEAFKALKLPRSTVYVLVSGTDSDFVKACKHDVIGMMKSKKSVTEQDGPINQDGEAGYFNWDPVKRILFVDGYF